MARTVDFTGVGDFTPAPLGEYEVEATKFDWRDNKDGNGEHCSMQYTITEELAEDGTKVQGKIVFQTYSPKPQALWKIKQDAMALGLDEELFEGVIDLDVVIPAMIGRKGLATLTIEEYENRKGETAYRNQIEEITEVPSSELAEVSGRRAKAS